MLASAVAVGLAAVVEPVVAVVAAAKLADLLFVPRQPRLQLVELAAAVVVAELVAAVEPADLLFVPRQPPRQLVGLAAVVAAAVLQPPLAAAVEAALLVAAAASEAPLVVLAAAVEELLVVDATEPLAVDVVAVDAIALLVDEPAVREGPTKKRV